MNLRKIILNNYNVTERELSKVITGLEAYAYNNEEAVIELTDKILCEIDESKTDYIGRNNE